MMTQIENAELDQRVARILDPSILPEEHRYETDVLQMMMMHNRRRRATSVPKRRRGRPPLPPGKHRKLTDAQVNQIVRLYRTGTISQKALAKQFHVSHMTVNNVLHHYFSDAERLQIGEKLRRKYYDDKSRKREAAQRAAQNSQSYEEQAADKIPDA